MALTNFFNINLPYGMRKIDNKWEIYNREYKILGWNSLEGGYDYPLELKTEYIRFTDNFIKNHISDKLISRDEKTGEITNFYFYNDGTNPGYDIKYWDRYSNIIKAFIKIAKK